jgi:catechol 2,3-dioxygenase-like lactoylglutathione lyase family enzyme
MSTPRIFRIILPVNDLDKATAFYSALLGTPGMRISGGRHYFDCGGVILACFNPRGDGDGWDARPNQDHIYFAVANLAAVYARAEKLGGLSQETGDGGLPMGKIERRPWGEVSFYLKDPFGNPLCFVDQTSVFTGKRRTPTRRSGASTTGRPKSMTRRHKGRRGAQRSKNQT